MNTSKLTPMMFLLICVPTLIMAGCPGPSEVSGVRTPNAIMDNSENTFVVYQANEGNSRVTYIQRLGYYGNIVWEGRGIELYSEPGPSEGGGITALLVGSQYGQTIIIWEDAQGIQAQKINSSGRFLWEEGITIVPHNVNDLKTAGDSEGGVILAWSDENNNLYVQRNDFDGNTVWKTESPLCNTEFFDMAVDEKDSTFIVWEDKDLNVFAQKLDPAGNITWTPSGVLISRNVTGGGMQSIISDGAGGAIMAWSYSKYIYAQRLNSEGETLWGTGGISLNTPVQMPVISMPIEPRLVSDGTGGAYIIWRDGMSIFGQRINASGDPVWQEDNMQIWYGEDSPSSPLFNAITDSFGGLIVVWNYIEEGKTLSDAPKLRAQRFDASGNKLWDESGIRVTESAAGYISPMQVSSDGQGGAIISWAAGDNVHNANYSIIQRIYSSGRTLWGENGTSLGWQ